MNDGQYEEPQIVRADNLIRELKPVDKTVGVKLVIQLVNGFERFGSHKRWEDGYRISDGEIVVEHENLLEALRRFKEKQNAN